MRSFYWQLPRVGNNQTFKLSGKHPWKKCFLICGPRKYPYSPEGGLNIGNSKREGQYQKSIVLIFLLKGS